MHIGAFLKLTLNGFSLLHALNLLILVILKMSCLLSLTIPHIEIFSSSFLGDMIGSKSD